MLGMNKPIVFTLFLLFFFVFSCSNTSKETKSSQISPQINESSTTVAAIKVPPIEMKSISPEGEKKPSLPAKTELGIPGKDEKKRLPEDFIIGELGSGAIPAAVYSTAQNFCKDLISPSLSNKQVQFLPLAEQESILSLIRLINPNQYRLGSGRSEGKDRYSFLIRILGAVESASGAVYIQLINSAWIIEDLSLEKDTKIEFNPLQYKHFL
jgi:hypothetical protein